MRIRKSLYFGYVERISQRMGHHDRFGFAALASAGSYNPENSFTGDDRTFFWSRTQDTFGDDDYDDAHMFLVQPLDEVVWVGSAGKIAQYSVRCIKY